jgi:hypothetical protein
MTVALGIETRRVDRLDFRLLVVIFTSENVVLRRPVEAAQYLSIRYTERFVETGIEPSLRSVDDNYDNALAETIN